MNNHHKEILALIQKRSGKPTQHTFSDNYLGNTHPRYPINGPTMREIAKAWMKAHREMPSAEFADLLSSLVKGKSATEKSMAGVLMDYSALSQRKFAPSLFDQWLDHLIGWAEVDAVCTGKYTQTEIAAQWKVWKKLLVQFSKSKNIQKRRASIVFLCAPLRKPQDKELVMVALENCDRLKAEKEVLITKAISWVLRSAIPHHKDIIKKYVDLNKDNLPKIAVRETLTKLKTGKKTKSKSK